jgi:hypothetical protein
MSPINFHPCDNIEALHYAVYVGGTPCLETGRKLQNLFSKKIDLIKQEQWVQSTRKVYGSLALASFIMVQCMPANSSGQKTAKLILMLVGTFSAYLSSRTFFEQRDCQWQLKQLEFEIDKLRKHP